MHEHFRQNQPVTAALLGNVMLSIFAAIMLAAGILKIVNLSAFAER